MASGTVKSVVDDAEYELLECGIAVPDRGRLIRLCSEAEKDFTRRTGCLTSEGKKTTTTSTDYDIQSATTAITERIVRIWAVSYDGKPLRKVSKAVLDLHPDYYSEEFKDLYTWIGSTTIRLGFTPSAGDDKLKFIYGYESNTTISGDSSDLTVPGQYHSAITTYIIAKYLMAISEDKANPFWQRYKMQLNETIKDLESMYN